MSASTSRTLAWETRRIRYGKSGHHATYRPNPHQRRTALETAALRLLARLHEEEVLSEEQICQALGLDRIEFREIVERFRGGNSVGERICIARRDAGMTQQQLADRINVNRSQVANIERGRSGVAVAQLISIAAALNVSAASLLPDPAKSDAPAASPADPIDLARETIKSPNHTTSKGER